MKSKIVLLFLVLYFQSGYCQTCRFDNFFKPADSLNLKRQNTVIVSQAAVSVGTLVGLNQLWYANYPRSKFHFVNDNAHWLQMDKAGHVFSSYQMGRLGSEMFKWSGSSQKNQLIYGAGLGFAFLTAVEVLDGYSKQWGASTADIIANAAGTAMYVSQELLWKEQRITPKFSFHSTQFAPIRPAILGRSFSEQILKDYNGQTYWLSINLYSFAKESKLPKWFNIALGYGAQGMLTAYEKNTELHLNNSARFR